MCVCMVCVCACVHVCVCVCVCACVCACVCVYGVCVCACVRALMITACALLCCSETTFMNSFVIGGSMEIRWMMVTLQQEYGMYSMYCTRLSHSVMRGNVCAAQSCRLCCVCSFGIRLVLMSCDSHVTHSHLARLFMHQLLKVWSLTAVCTCGDLHMNVVLRVYLLYVVCCCLSLPSYGCRAATPRGRVPLWRRVWPSGSSRQTWRS